MRHQLKSIYGLLIVSLVISACTTGNQTNDQTEELPNIVVIMADDMGYGDVAHYNSESKIPSPNMDKLASEGITFTDAHSPAAVCTPSRYGILTGRYCWRSRLKKGVILGYDEVPLIEKERLTIASLLKQKGYNSACIGKWHLGLNWQTKDGYVLQNDSNKWKGYSGAFRANEEHVDFTKPVSGGPLDLGFDYFYGTLGCSTSDPPYCFIENKQTVGIPSKLSTEDLNHLPGFVKGLMVPDWSQENVDLIFTQKATAFIDNNQQKTQKKPFFLYLALSSPHIPFMVPDFAKGKSEEGPRGDLVTVVDWSVGKVMETLDQYGLSDNTLVIVTSDNGPRKGANGHSSAGRYRGYKGSAWEGGHRVPFIARWPGQITPGSTSEEVISLTDLYATFGALTNTKTSTGGEDSHNVLEALIGNKQKDADERIRIFHSGAGLFAIRKGDWKMIEGARDTAIDPIKKNKSKLAGQLFNLSTDPFETNDLWEEEQKIVEELMGLLKRSKMEKTAI